jgi:hypothetical protein
VERPVDVDSINPLEKAAPIGRIGGTQDREKRRRRGDEFSFPHAPQDEQTGTRPEQPAPAEDSYIYHYDDELEQAFRDKGDMRVSICGDQQTAPPTAAAAAVEVHKPQSEQNPPQHIDRKI